MNVIVFASRKGGTGKSSLAAHLATFAHKPSRPCLLVDADPQGSLSQWHSLRGDDGPALRNGGRGLADTLRSAKRDGYEWVFVDTPPLRSTSVVDAIRAATMVVVPARPGVFDVVSVQETIEIARAARKPFAVVINGAPARREDAESPLVTQTRASLEAFEAPVWSGQITHRTSIPLALAAGAGAREFDPASPAAIEIARLWTAIEKSVKAINGARQGASVMHRAA